ncbi:MAG: histone deacetylase [Ignavibacteriae bacterium]|nr:histone deacetylase [Ignavibacteria bacterium]MBI3365396.1 histone deacetylase [Ignavibacteriota bacterium]
MPSRTGFVYHDRFLEHDTGPGHPERPDRLRSITHHLKQQNLWPELHHLIIDQALEESLLSVHKLEHVKFVKESCRRGTRLLDSGDTCVSSESYDVALLAAGGAIAAVDAVANGLLKNVFCAVRPPGHHAERNRIMGFCLFNTIAIAARHAQTAFGLKRIAIVDWDVHHGNGTQEIFYADRSILFISTHQYPLWPGTGARDEQGEGEGRGYTLNIPMPPGSGEKEYVDAFTREILPALDGYRPELILISAGFDAHRDDPLANINLTEETFAKLTSLIMEMAETCCDGKIVSLLEGGYNLQALARSVEAHIRTLVQSA